MTDHTDPDPTPPHGIPRPTLHVTNSPDDDGYIYSLHNPATGRTVVRHLTAEQAANMTDATYADFLDHLDDPDP